MSVIGIGVDLVDIARFERSIARTPRLRDRLFTAAELVGDGVARPVRSLAGRFAAKEALIKAFGDSVGAAWHDMVVTADGLGNPGFALAGAAREAAAARGIARIHLTISHDAGLAIAFVVAES